jgi:hypothetical protein
MWKKVAAALFKVLLRYGGWGSNTPNMSRHHTVYEAKNSEETVDLLVPDRQETVYADDWNID